MAGGGSGGAARAFGLLGSAGRIVAELVVGEAGEFPVPDAAVDLTRLLHAFADVLLVVVVARLQPEERLEELGLDDLVAFEFDVADLVAPPFGNRDVQLDAAGLLVLGIAQIPLLGHSRFERSGFSGGKSVEPEIADHPQNP